MRARPLTAGGFTLLALAVSLTGTPVSHAGPDQKEPVALPTPPSPADLTAADQLSLLNKRLKKLGKSKVTHLPDGRIRLTPHSHTHDSGAKIRSMAGLIFENAAVGHDGVYMLHWTTADGSWQEIKLEYPTQVGKIHVLDCRVRAIGKDADWKTVTVTPDLRVSSDYVVSDDFSGADGHVLVAFTAKFAKTSVRLELRRTSLDYETVTWYGCDLLGAG